MILKRSRSNGEGRRRRLCFYALHAKSPHWKGGKDRARRSFNPDFFIKIDLDGYISRLGIEEKQDRVEKLKKLLRLKLRE